MRIHLRFDSSNEEHTRSTLFINGKNSGSLCMSPRETCHLYQVLAAGVKHLNAEYGDARLERSEAFQFPLGNTEKEAPKEA